MPRKEQRIAVGTTVLIEFGLPDRGHKIGTVVNADNLSSIEVRNSEDTTRHHIKSLIILNS